MSCSLAASFPQRLDPSCLCMAWQTPCRFRFLTKPTGQLRCSSLGFLQLPSEYKSYVLSPERVSRKPGFLHKAPTCAEHLHFTLNGETRRAPGPPVACAQTAWEDADQVSFVVPQYSHRQAWARAAQPPGQTDLHPGKKEKLTNKQ
jgi:hypothetical protein